MRERTVGMNKKQAFILEIMDNQKNTWQGQIRWIQGGKECPFRSVLELLHLIDSAINDHEDRTESSMWVTEPNDR